MTPCACTAWREALTILADARRQNLPVAVYGDYDVDGVCACALMTQAFAPATGFGPTPTRRCGRRATA